MNEPIYLDHHSATPPSSESLNAFVRVSKEYFGAISSWHFVGQQGMYPLQKTVEQLFDQIGAGEKDELCLIQAEEAIRQIFFHTYLYLSRESGKTLFLTSKSQETIQAKLALQLQELGCTHKVVPLNGNGQITSQALETMISSRVALFSTPWADGLTGVIHPIEDLSRVCREKNILFHLDASFIFGKRFFRFQDVEADFLTIDGASIESIPNTGLCMIKEKNLFRASFIQTNPSVALTSALSIAMSERLAKFEHYCMEIARLRDLLEEGIMQKFSEAVVLFKEVDRLPNTTVIAFPGVYAEALAYLLNSRGVYASLGGGKFDRLENILLGAGVDDEIAKCSLSFSLSWDTSEEEIISAIERIARCANQIKNCNNLR